MKKRLGLFALLIAAALLLTACGNSLEGSWEYTGGTGDAAAIFDVIKANGGSTVFTFKSGKMTVTVNADGKSQDYIEAQYTTNGKTIKLSPTSGSASEGEFKVDGKKLTLTLEGSVINLEKK